MMRHWTAPAVLGVLAAVLTVWCLGVLEVLLTDGLGSAALTVPALRLVYAAGPAVLCAVPLVVITRAVLPRAGGSPGVYALLGLVGGALVGVAQTGVLLSAWPWELSAAAAREMVGLPALGGLVGGVVAGVVRARRSPRDLAAARDR
ncbi:hypothetical protein [Cellulomonas wangsupingiae]|uniref:Uncharacterized protein n=1 Tax=Cellulomonas wangsupingiae TaxID=2968085 RepID=A0ABY5K6W0_9CELL|nr:hypothetical protein [Cellulomonas wangsupingiae]MCC2334524.1 hypothetical protein [Cellulomonas wangsupingiae]UUI66181.1 hypothetical protein NP075_05520 [Cellulomonas wangsupingiae]